MNKTVMKGISRLHGYYFVYQRLLAQSAFWTEDRKHDFLLSYLRNVLLHASEQVPFYRELFREIDFNVTTDFKELHDLGKLPRLTKSDILSRFESLIDRKYLRSSIEAFTSGTTGQPMRMYLHEKHLAYDAGCVFRHWSLSGYSFRNKVVALRSYVPENNNGPLWKYSRAQNTLYMSAYHLTKHNAREYIDAILDFRPDILRGYPSSINVLAEYAFPRRQKFGFLKGIYTSSETLLPSERENIENTFGKKLFDWYGMTEPAIVITECEAHEGLHVNWEYGYTEFVQTDGLSGDEYQMVTTSLHNPVMPFIRYETGDIVTLFKDGRRCSCGRNQPIVKSISGRKDECIITPDGRRLPSVNFYTVFRKYTQILRFQIIQYGQRDVLVKLQVRPNASFSAENHQRLKEELLVRFGNEVRCEIEESEKFLTNADGKTLPIVRRPGTRSVEEREEYTVSSQTAWGLQRAGQEVLKLDWNESDELPSVKVLETLRECLEHPSYVYWYPDGDSSGLIQKLADYCSIPAERIMITHGSDMAMEILLTSLISANDKVLLVTPTYDHFRAMAEQRGARILNFEFYGLSDFPFRQFVEYIQNTLPRMVYLGSPNNPIGYTLPNIIIEKIVEVCSNLSIVTVVDEAYYEFCGKTSASLVLRYPNVIVLRSFSKAFGLAGLRLGYSVCSQPLVSSLAKVYNPKSVTMLAKRAAEVSLADIASVTQHVARVKEGRRRIIDLLKCHNVFVYPTEANFVLLRHERCPALMAFLAEHNVMVRDRTKFFAGVPHVRITIGGPKSVEKLLMLLEMFFVKPESTPDLEH